MDRNERTVASACGIMKLDGMTVPKTVRDSISRCLRDEAVFDFAVTYIAGARAGYRSFHRIERSPDDPYCYADTDTPVNRLNIRDGGVLRTKVRDVVPIRIAELERHPITAGMSSGYLTKVHGRLFGDIFSWAGEYRTTDCMNACRSVLIGQCVDGLFNDLKNEDFLSGTDNLTGKLAHYMTELLAIRPFRYGNGITVRVLTNCIAVMNGKYLDYSKASESLTEIAVSHAIAGDLSHLKEILDGIISDY